MSEFFPIDLVYLWVDGSDPKFQECKRRYLNKQDIKHSNDAVGTHRWRDNNELLYSLRSVNKFAPWINHIYIVTGLGQVPKWLNIKNKKITIVPQESILPKDASPVFNSCAIEMCLANIPGLSEHFLLANDDMFFADNVGPDYFFDKNGRAKYRCVSHRKHSKVPSDVNNLYLYQLVNAAREIEIVYGLDLYRFKPVHGIDPYIKSSMMECCVHPGFVGVINATKYHRFRQRDDIQRMVFSLYDLVNKRAKFILSHPLHTGRHYWLNMLFNTLHRRSVKVCPFYCIDAITDGVLKHRPPIVCINDDEYTTDLNRKHNVEFFNTLFPDKCEFEK